MHKQKVYRIFEVKNGKVMSLFHSTNGTRCLPLDTWIKANVKDVKDGSSKFIYKAGFHVLKSKEEAENFFNKMFRIKENRYILPCYVRGDLRPKHSENSRSINHCLLSDEIYISSKEIENGLLESA